MNLALFEFVQALVALVGWASFICPRGLRVVTTRVGKKPAHPTGMLGVGI